jgi:hypothetical protein
LAFKGKHISKFLILFAGLIILTHAIVPHHHHFHCIDAPPAASPTCEEPHTDKHNENQATHCHAFNLLIFEKTNIPVKLAPFEFDFHFDLFSIETSPKTTVEISASYKICCIGLILQKQLFCTSSSLRAPPVTA